MDDYLHKAGILKAERAWYAAHEEAHLRGLKDSAAVALLANEAARQAYGRTIVNLRWQATLMALQVSGYHVVPVQPSRN